MNTQETVRFLARQCLPRFVCNRSANGKSFVLAISGTSPAVGKTTLSLGVSDMLGNNAGVHIDLDNWIALDRRSRVDIGKAGIDPSIWDMDGLRDVLYKLTVLKKSVIAPVYNHVTGMPCTQKVQIDPRGIVCLAGASALWPSVREFVNVLVCIQPASDEDAREMTVSRNLKERSYSFEMAMRDYVVTKSAYAAFIAPHSLYADLNLVVKADYSYSFG